MDANLDRYIEAHSSTEPEWLYELNRRTNLRLLNGRMCSGPVQGRLLKMLTGMIAPRRALELGTFSGYSALCIAEGMPPDGHLDTIEADDELEDFIRDALAHAPAGTAGEDHPAHRPGAGGGSHTAARVIRPGLHRRRQA